MQTKVQYLKINAAIQLAYHRLEGHGPGVVFCGGFMSDQQGSKALFLEDYCRERGLAFVRFDYRGHGASTGQLVAANISAWLADTLAVLDQLTAGPQLLIGSSMGAWLATLATVARPARIAKLVCLAAAPDFTENLIWARLNVEQRAHLLRDELLVVPTQDVARSYQITRQFIEDGRRNLVLKALLPITCPVQLMHGLQDSDVPWHTSLQLAETIQSAQLALTLIKTGDHRLARAEDLQVLSAALSLE